MFEEDSVTREAKVGIFKFLQFEERFRKPPFWLRISVDGRPNRCNKGPQFKLIHFSRRIRHSARSNLFPRLRTVFA